MRVLLLLFAATCALAGCKNNDKHDNMMNTEENLTAENIVSNDVTAIDAVTGDAANMAADVPVNYGNVDENGAAEPSSEPTKAKTPVAREPRQRTPNPAPEPTTTTTTTTAANQL